MQTAKTSGQFENTVFEIHIIRENTRLIARWPFHFFFRFNVVSFKRKIESIRSIRKLTAGNSRHPVKKISKIVFGEFSKFDIKPNLNTNPKTKQNARILKSVLGPSDLPAF